MFELDKSLGSTHLSIHVSSLGFCYHMVVCLVHNLFCQVVFTWKHFEFFVVLKVTMRNPQSVLVEIRVWQNPLISWLILLILCITITITMTLAMGYDLRKTRVPVWMFTLLCPILWVWQEKVLLSNWKMDVSYCGMELTFIIAHPWELIQNIPPKDMGNGCANWTYFVNSAGNLNHIKESHENKYNLTMGDVMGKFDWEAFAKVKYLEDEYYW